METGARRFAVLGALQFERDGQAVPIPSGHQRTLLVVLLAAAGAPVSRDALIEELWGERPPASAVSTLHVHLSKLRALLDGLLVSTAGGYALRSDAFELDVDRFDELVAQARADEAHAGELLGQALQLVRGEPLCDVAAERAVGRWRRELEEKVIAARIARFDAELAAGAAAALVPELERLADRHPFEERLTGQLMLALHRAGRQADALAAYQRTRRLFASELGIEPGEVLRRLQEQILAQDPALLATEPVPRGTPAGETLPRSQLPNPPTRLIGREAELASLAGLATDPDVRLVTLTGTGGVGKTRLLLAFAESQTAHFADGVAFVALERVTEATLVRSEIASALAQPDAGAKPSADTLARFLHERELLLALDNFEHLLDAATVVAELLAQAPRLRVVVSSRSPLRIRGEQIVDVQPLSLPVGDSEQAIGESAATQFFLHYALAANRKLELGAGTMHAIATICRALDGLPLAIELAASRTRGLTPQEIAEQLGEPLALGARSLRDLPDRHQSLEATIRWSYDLLSPGARTALRRASIFAGGFDLGALSAVCGAGAADALEELADASLLSRSPGSGRWTLLELVRAFALTELEAEGELPAVRQRHRRHFAACATPAITAFDSGVPASEIAVMLRADHANLRAALDDAIAARDRDAAVAIALGMRSLWFTSALRREAQITVDRVLDRFELSAADEIALLKAGAYGAAYAADASRLERLAARGAELGDRGAQTTATFNQFSIAISRRDREMTRRLRPTLEGFLTSTDSEPERASVHYYLALDAHLEGAFDDACSHAAACVESARAIGSDYLIGAGVSMGLLARLELDGSITHPALSEAVAVAGKVGEPGLSAVALWLAALYAADEAPEASARWIADGERLREALDSTLWPETVPRDQALAVLGLDIESLLAATPVRDHLVALAEVAGWLADREAGRSVDHGVGRPARRPLDTAPAEA